MIYNSLLNNAWSAAGRKKGCPQEVNTAGFYEYKLRQRHCGTRTRLVIPTTGALYRGPESVKQLEKAGTRAKGTCLNTSSLTQVTFVKACFDATGGRKQHISALDLVDIVHVHVHVHVYPRPEHRAQCAVIYSIRMYDTGSRKLR